MKKISILLFASFLFFSCKKENTNTYKVKFSATGNNVTQFKFYTGSTEVDKTVPFTGTQDTVINVAIGTNLKLDLKANSNNLSGTIFVNDVQVITGMDNDIDGDGKSQVKIEYNVVK